MKKFTKIFLSLFFALTLLVAPFGLQKKAYASSINNYNDFQAEIYSILANYVSFDERVAGSESEKNAADYIKNYLDTKTTLSPLNNEYVVGGVQNFTFESEFSGKYENSQNIIYSYKTTKETNHKVIIYTSYDSVAYKLNEKETGYDLTKSEGVNSSAGSVALLLLLAENLPSLNLDYNVDICFFGAGTSSSAGAKVYLKGISEESKKDILCAINLTTLSLGKNLYFYQNEIENNFSKYLCKVVKNNNLRIKQDDTKHLNKVVLAEANELGLTYSHIAMESDNKQFMKQGITSISLFSGEYDSGIIIGRNEFSGKDVVTYTENDNLNYIQENFGLENVYNNLFNAYSFITTTLTDSDFQTKAVEAYGSFKTFYNFFGNEKLITYLTLIAFVVFVIVAMYMYYKFTVKSYYSNIEMEFLSTVVRISEQVDKDRGDPEVSKVVSQVIASDIKKDKTLKSKRKKNKDK